MKITKNQLKEIIRQSLSEYISEADSDKYTHIGYGKYREKGKEKDKDAPTFKKTDDGEFVPFKKDKGGVSVKKSEPKAKPKATKISADPFGGDDVGGPAHPNVPKGVKSSKRAKATKYLNHLNNNAAKDLGFKDAKDLVEDSVIKQLSEEEKNEVVALIQEYQNLGE